MQPLPGYCQELHCWQLDAPCGHLQVVGSLNPIEWGKPESPLFMTETGTKAYKNYEEFRQIYQDDNSLQFTVNTQIALLPIMTAYQELEIAADELCMKRRAAYNLLLSYVKTAPTAALAVLVKNELQSFLDKCSVQAQHIVFLRALSQPNDSTNNVNHARMAQFYRLFTVATVIEYMRNCIGFPNAMFSHWIQSSGKIVAKNSSDIPLIRDDVGNLVSVKEANSEKFQGFLVRDFLLQIDVLQRRTHSRH